MTEDHGRGAKEANPPWILMPLDGRHLRYHRLHLGHRRCFDEVCCVTPVDATSVHSEVVRSIRWAQ